MTKTNNVGLFGTRTRTETLLIIYMLEATHASELAKILGKTLSQIQAAVDSLERAGLIVGRMEGTARRLTLNPRFHALAELRALLNKTAIVEKSIQKRLADLRRRPRRSGKTI